MKESLSFAIHSGNRHSATGSRPKAFWYSLGSGIVEPIGALLGYFVLIQFFNEYVFGVVSLRR